MASFNKRNKPNVHGIYPANHEALPGKTDHLGSGFTRVEPWITPERLKKEWLFGIPLVSPLTKEKIDDETIKNIIAKAAARVELECNIDVLPVVRVVRAPWDAIKYRQGYGQIDIGTKAIRNLLEVSIRSSDSYQVIQSTEINNTDANREGRVIFNIPLEWIDQSYLRKGIIHIVPLSVNPILIPSMEPAYSSAILMGLPFKMNNLPSYFFIRYVSGFEENAIPSIVNDLIGIYAAIDILSLLGPTNKWNSQSIGLDGASQGVSGPGNQLYVVRITELREKAENLKAVIKARFTNKVFMRHI